VFSDIDIVTCTRREKKNQFLRYIFHELRAPLHCVGLAVDELQLASHGKGA
jgi:hypothetical protein